MRIERTLILIGFVMIVVSFTGGSGRGGGANVRYGECGGQVFKAYGNVLVEAEDFYSHSFSIYILTWSSFQYILENGSLEDVDPVAIFEKVDGSIETIIELPGTGFYAILFTPYFNETINVDFQVIRATPRTGILLPGIGVVIIGVVVVVLSVLPKWIYRRK